MDITGTVDWSNLPVELWPLIGEKLKLRIEYLRFRSVCNSWRSYLPPFLPSSPPKFPLPFSSDGPTSFLSQNTVYLLRPPSTSSSTSSPPGGWLVKVEECDRMLLRNPITSRRIKGSKYDTSSPVNDMSLSSSAPGCFNLLELDMIELGKSYFLRYIRASGSVCGLKKVVAIASEIGECSILVISDKGELGSAKSGDQKIRWFGHEGCVFDDVVVYKGQSYAVDSLGCVFRINMSSDDVMTKISSKVVGLLGGRKHLVESCGELYVVDRYFDEEQSKLEERRGVELDFRIFGRRGRYRRFRSDELKVAEFKVYKLEWGDGELGRWVEVKSLGDQVLFLANDCSFAVSAQELAGGKGNCIYFTDENDVNLALREVTRPESFVFDLEDRSIQKLESSQMFWPPPVEFGCSSSSVD